MTHSKSQIKELLEAHDLHLRRGLGQNFMIDANTARRIAALADVTSTDNVLEIGPGLGSLTLALHQYRPRIVAIEYDRGMVAALRDVVADTDKISVIEADAMRVDWHAVVESDDWVLVANLPYNIATPLVCDLLDEVPQISRMLILVQDEDGKVALQGAPLFTLTWGVGALVPMLMRDAPHPARGRLAGRGACRGARCRRAQGLQAPHAHAHLRLQLLHPALHP